jgi:hypothetical protein
MAGHETNPFSEELTAPTLTLLTDLIKEVAMDRQIMRKFWVE